MYLSADLLLADGAPVVWASRLLGDKLPGRVTGADLMPALLEHAKSGTRVAVVGSVPKQADSDAVWLSRHFPNIDLRIFAPPVDLDVRSEASIKISEDVAEFAPQLVFVCLGFPKQERWAQLHRDRMTGAVVLCCGAALDFHGGSRAPRSNIGTQGWIRVALALDVGAAPPMA